MRTFIENYLHFIKNCIRPPYKKLKSLKSGFIENSNFENNRDPCSGIYWLIRSLLGLLAVYPTLPFGLGFLPHKCFMSVWLCKRVNALLKGEDLYFMSEFSCYSHAFKILIFLNWEWWTLKAFQRICQYSRAS